MSRLRPAQADARFRVMRLLEENPQMSQRELADAVGISVGAVHYMLRALVEKGFVKFGNFSSASDKRRYAYVLTPKGLREKAELTRSFLARKHAEYDALRAEIAALEADLENAPQADTPRPGADAKPQDT